MQDKQIFVHQFELEKFLPKQVNTVMYNMRMAPEPRERKQTQHFSN